MPDQLLILTVASNRRNLELLCQFLGKEGYTCQVAATLEECDAALDSGTAFGLALVDIGGFDGSIWQRCERLRSLEIPLLVISPRQSASIQEQSLASGAHSVLVKPLVVKELLGLLRSLLASP